MNLISFKGHLFITTLRILNTKFDKNLNYPNPEFSTTVVNLCFRVSTAHAVLQHSSKPINFSHTWPITIKITIKIKVKNRFCWITIATSAQQASTAKKNLPSTKSPEVIWRNQVHRRSR